MTDEQAFWEWWISAPHRKKYDPDHPATLAAREAWRAGAIIAASASAQPSPQYTEGHCENKRKPGGCPLHNLHCGYPECDRKAAPPQSTADTVRVPREPTKAMMQAFCDTTCYYLPGDHERPGLVWAAMIAAAPQQVAQGPRMSADGGKDIPL